MKKNRVAFISFDLPYNEFVEKEENKITSFLDKDEIENVLQLAVTPATWKGGGWVNVSLLYEKSLRPQKRERSGPSGEERPEPTKKRPKPQALR